LRISDFRAYLQTEAQLPGKPDSISVDVYGDGGFERIEFTFVDAFGERFSKTAADQPVLWSGQWKPVKTYLKSFGSAFDYPASLEKMTVYLVPGAFVEDSVFSGTIYLDNLRVIYVPTTNVSNEAVQPSAFELEQNYPNPFNPATKYIVRIGKASSVSLRIFDLLGREVATLLEKKLSPGVYTIPWNASRMPSGIYFAQLRAGEEIRIRKTILAK
jgi:hypothetical protein